MSDIDELIKNLEASQEAMINADKALDIQQATITKLEAENKRLTAKCEEQGREIERLIEAIDLHRIYTESNHWSCENKGRFNSRLWENITTSSEQTKEEGDV